MTYLKIKRILDIIFSLILLILLSPLFIIIIILIKIDSKGPILFKQRRIGQFKKEFLILKFRTMRIDTPKDTPTHLLENPEKYITKLGKFLRKSSLDELPQLFNILIGEMSFVGPRPALWNQYDLISERDRYKINDIPVGLTGWAQVNGRDELEIIDKVKFDYYYKSKISMCLDLKCNIKTIFSVLNGNGVKEGSQNARSK